MIGIYMKEKATTKPVPFGSISGKTAWARVSQTPRYRRPGSSSSAPVKDTCLFTPHPVAPDCRLPVAPGPQCHVHCLPCRVAALQLRHLRPPLCFLQPSYPQRLSVMRVIVWVLVLATTLPEVLSLRLILLPYSLTLEVAKVNYLFSYLFSKLSAPVLSPYSYPIPLLSKKSGLPSHVCMCPGCPQPQVRALHTFRPLAHLCT